MNPIEAAAKVIDPLAFAEQGSCPPRGWEHSTPKEVARLIERRKAHAIRVAERVITAYHNSEIEALRANLADCQAVVRSRGHDADCPVTQCCKVCGTPKMWTAHRSIFDDYPEYHEFEPGPCSDTCGHDRTTGEKA